MRSTSRVLQFPAPPEVEACTRPILGWGIWNTPYLVGGHRAMTAVDATGTRIAEVAVLDESRREEIGEALWNLLLTVSPAPRVVK